MESFLQTFGEATGSAAITHLRIGGQSWLWTGAGDHAQARQMDCFAPFFSQTAPQDFIVLRFVEEALEPACHTLMEYRVGTGNCSCRFGVDAEGVYYYSFSCGGVLRYDSRQPLCATLSPLGDKQLLLYALWLAFGLPMLRRGALLMHSSVVDCAGMAVMCLGESGTGKSTHTQLWTKLFADCSLLNDDSPLVRLEEGGVRCYGSPWSGKGAIFRSEGLPLAAMVRLRQAPHNAIMRQGAAAAMGCVLPSCPPPFSADAECFGAEADLVGRIVERVPVYMLDCLPNEAAARLCRKAVVGDNLQE